MANMIGPTFTTVFQCSPQNQKVKDEAADRQQDQIEIHVLPRWR
jgi:hypothetical protein